MQNNSSKFITKEVFNFKLFFGKYKGQFLSNTPMSYRTWLVQSDFYKGLTIKFPVRVKMRNGDGDTWWDYEKVKVQVLNPDWDQDLATSYHTEDPEERHWKNLATWNERHCDHTDLY